MNKLLTKIVGAALGLAMTIGVGVMVGNNTRESAVAYASYDVSSSASSSVVKDKLYAVGAAASSNDSTVYYLSGKDGGWGTRTNDIDSALIFTASASGTSNFGLYYTKNTQKYYLTPKTGDGNNFLDFSTSSKTIQLSSSTVRSGAQVNYNLRLNGTSGFRWYGKTTGAGTTGTAAYLYEVTEISGFDVTFNSNGGSISPDKKTVANGGTFVFPSPGTKAGWKFDGWSSNGGTTKYAIGATSPAVTAAILYTAYWSVDAVTSVTLTLGTFSKTYYTTGTWDWQHLTVTYGTESGASGTATGLTKNDFTFTPAAPNSTSIDSVSVYVTYSNVKSNTLEITGITITEKTNIGGIVDGGKYVMVWDDGYYLPSANYASNPGPLIAYTDSVHNVESNCWTFEEEGNSDDTWNIKSSSGEYLYCTNTAQGVKTGTLDSSNNQFDFTVSDADSTHLGKPCLLLTAGTSGGNRTLTHYTNNSGNDIRAYTNEQNGTWEVVLIPYEAPDYLNASLTISGYTDSFIVGDTFEFGGTATAKYTHGDENVTSSITFKLDNETINIGDTITSDMVGEDITVDVRYEDAKSNVATASYTVDIAYAPVSSVSIKTSTSEMGKISNFTFGAEVLPANANQNVSWSVAKKSGDITTGFSIDQNSGLLSVNADAGGVLTVTATTVGLDSSSAQKVATVDVTITGDPVVVVSSALAGFSGKNTNLAYSFSNFTATLSVSSSDTNKVTVGTPTVTTGASGNGTVQVNFLAAGSSVLTFKNGSSDVATCNVTVTASAVSSVTWTNAEDMTVYSGSTALNASKISSWAPKYEMNNGDKGSVNSNYTIQLNGISYTLGNALQAGIYSVSLSYGGQTTSVNPTLTVVQSLNSISHNQSNNYSHTSSSKWTSYTEAQTLSGVSWTPDITWAATAPDVQNVDGTKGQQIGTKNNSASAVKLSTTGIGGTITQVVVNTSGANDIDASVSVKVGTTSFTCSGQTSTAISSTATEYTFIGSASGKIEISWSSSGGKAIYFKSVSVSSSLNKEYSNQEGHEAAQNAVVTFAKAFNTALGGTSYCTTGLSDAWSDASDAWDDFKTTISSLSTAEQQYAKDMIKYAEAKWTENTDNDYAYCLERAMATYEYCVANHGCTPFIKDGETPLRSNLTPTTGFNGLFDSSNQSIIVVIISLISLAGVGVVLYKRKRQSI